jgi:hypothetical protein
MNEQSKLRQVISRSLLCLISTIVAQSSLSQTPKLTVAASFTNKRAIKSTELIHLRLNRPLGAAEGSLAVFVSQTDISSLFTITRTGLDYSPQALHLPQGENTLTVYLVSPTGEWKEVAKFLLHVENDMTSSSESLKTDSKWYGFDKFEVNPSLSLNLKSESTLLFFPDTNRPTRINFLDLALQGSLQTNLVRGSFSAQNQFDFVGTTYQKEALRFGDLSEQAPQIDLSSYLVQAQVKKIKFVFGHHSYGTNRFLIDNFSSRGINVSVPLGSRFDVSFNATNGTSIVGWNNFSGLGTRSIKSLRQPPEPKYSQNIPATYVLSLVCCVAPFSLLIISIDKT